MASEVRTKQEIFFLPLACEKVDKKCPQSALRQRSYCKCIYFLKKAERGKLPFFQLVARAPSWGAEDLGFSAGFEARQRWAGAGSLDLHAFLKHRLPKFLHSAQKPLHWGISGGGLSSSVGS